jgi:hypothetical protein
MCIALEKIPRPIAQGKKEGFKARSISELPPNGRMEKFAIITAHAVPR